MFISSQGSSAEGNGNAAWLTVLSVTVLSGRLFRRKTGIFHDGEGEWPSTPAITLPLLTSLNTSVDTHLDCKQKKKKCHKPCQMHFLKILLLL